MLELVHKLLWPCRNSSNKHLIPFSIQDIQLLSLFLCACAWHVLFGCIVESTAGSFLAVAMPGKTEYTSCLQHEASCEHVAVLYLTFCLVLGDAFIA